MNIRNESFCESAQIIVSRGTHDASRKPFMGVFEMENTTFDGKKFHSARETAQALGFCEKTLWNNTEPRGPIPCYKVGSRVLYDLGEAVEAVKKYEF